MAKREKCSEISVGINQDAILLGGAFKDFLIARGLHLKVAHVARLVPRSPQTFCDGRRQCVIDKEPQDLVTDGISRSRTASAA